MGRFVSRRAEVGIAKESSRGTAVNPTLWLPWSTCGLSDKIEHVKDGGALGRIEDSDYSYVTSKYSQGTVEAEMRAGYIGLILTNLMGATPVTSDAGPYTHTYTLQNSNSHQSISILMQDKTSPDINKMVTNAMIESWKMTVEPGKIVTNSIDFIGKAGKDWTGQTSAFTAMGLKFLAQHLSLKVAANIAGLAAATQLDVKGLEFNIEKNVLKNDVAGTVEPTDFNNQQLTVTGSITLNLEDNTWLNYMLAQTDRAMEIKLNAGTTGILTFQLPLVHFHSYEPTRNIDEIATQKIEFVAHYDAANAAAIISTCTLVNSVAGGSY